MYTTINLITSPAEAKGKRNNIVDSIQTALGVNIQDDIGSIKMLDVGCGAGNLIRYARSLGVDAQGIDVNLFHNNQDLPIVQ